MNSETRHTFDEQLTALEHRLLDMGNLVVEMLDKSIIALSEQDTGIADEVIRLDDQVDDMDVEIEQSCMRLLALQQPMARDLRTIGTAMKVITDIERMGDHAVDLAKISKRLAKEKLFKPLVDIPRLAELAKVMVRESLEAFVKRDMDLVIKVCQDDDAVDALYNKLFHELLEFMQKDSKLVIQCTYLLFVTRFLERIADHATNVAERVAYMETGVLQQLVRSHMSTSESIESV